MLYTQYPYTRSDIQPTLQYRAAGVGVAVLANVTCQTVWLGVIWRPVNVRGRASILIDLGLGRSSNATRLFLILACKRQGLSEIISSLQRPSIYTCATRQTRYMELTCLTGAVHCVISSNMQRQYVPLALVSLHTE